MVSTRLWYALTWNISLFPSSNAFTTWVSQIPVMLMWCSTFGGKSVQLVVQMIVPHETDSVRFFFVFCEVGRKPSNAIFREWTSQCKGCSQRSRLSLLDWALQVQSIPGFNKYMKRSLHTHLTCKKLVSSLIMAKSWKNCTTKPV